MAAEGPRGTTREGPDLGAQNPTWELGPAHSKARKSVSRQARSHPRQPGASEAEGSRAPIPPPQELTEQKGNPSSPPPPPPAEPSGSPKEATASPRPGLCALSKAGDGPPETPLNKAIGSPPGFSSKGLSPPPQHPQDESPRLPPGAPPGSPKAQGPRPEEEGPLNLTLDGDLGRQLDCLLFGARCETIKGPSIQPRAHLRQPGGSRPDNEGSPVDVDFQSRLPAEREGPAEVSPLSPLSPPPAKKPKPGAPGEAGLLGKRDASAGAFWAPDVAPSLLSLSADPEPDQDPRCELCGQFFETRKSLSRQARSHLGDMGVTEWYVQGSPIDTLTEILKGQAQPPAGGPPDPPPPGPKALAKALAGGPGGSLEVQSASGLHLPPPAQKQGPSSGPLSPTIPPPPPARRRFPGRPLPSLQEKLKSERRQVEIRRERLTGSPPGEGRPPEAPRSPREDMAALSLSSWAEPVRSMRCELCGGGFEDRRGLACHARSHLRHMGVTKWSGSPIDALGGILEKKAEARLVRKEPAPAGPPSPRGQDGPQCPGNGPQALSLTPLRRSPGKPGPGPGSLLSQPFAGFLTPLVIRRPLPNERLLSREMKPKTPTRPELPLKTEPIHGQSSQAPREAGCELCGLHFEKRQALASHARAHLRRLGVTEWSVKGSPIETLREFIRRSRPHKVEAYDSQVPQGRPSLGMGRPSGPRRDGDKHMPLTLAPHSLTLMDKHPGREVGPHRQAHPSRGEASDSQQKRDPGPQPPPRTRCAPSLVPRPPQKSLVTFRGPVYTLKCRFCEVQFQGPLSIQQEWVRHLQRHILERNFSQAEPEAPEAQPGPEPQ
ncbi:protein Wiz-like [Sminthopsis crassicaudata]|uniref:protein Wiz-like n=1 Tax=Sminthopsis crassicaudata TaxID=9301 RepID=UPI003D690053